MENGTILPHHPIRVVTAISFRLPPIPSARRRWCMTIDLSCSKRSLTNPQMTYIPWNKAIGYACLIWYVFIVLVCCLGVTQIFRYRQLSAIPNRHDGDSESVIENESSMEDEPLVENEPSVEDEVSRPHVTIIRPVMGYDPGMYKCLESTFRLKYPSDRLSIFLCVHSRSDPSYTILSLLVTTFKPRFDVQIFIQDEDITSVYTPVEIKDKQTCPFPPSKEAVSTPGRLGPNPKIGNMSEAYRQAKGDIIWLVDCNVWVSPTSADTMVNTLCGFGGRPKSKFVHQMPLVVDIGPPFSPFRSSSNSWLSSFTGGRLEEMFMSSTHAKFYTAINTALVSPCTVGKSNMFRRSMLDYLTGGVGLDYFSHFLCEDLLMGDLIWRGRLPTTFQLEPLQSSTIPVTFGDYPHIQNHSLVFGDPVIQPMWGMTTRHYISRRIRWLRVRKYGVKLATFVEPGIEPFLCSLYGAWAVTSLPCIFSPLFSSSWLSFCTFWLISVSSWAVADYWLYCVLHSRSSAPASQHPWRTLTVRPFLEWLPTWILRETLALPVWMTAVYGGAEIDWRGKRFHVCSDMTVNPT